MDSETRRSLYTPAQLTDLHNAKTLTDLQLRMLRDASFMTPIKLPKPSIPSSKLSPNFEEKASVDLKLPQPVRSVDTEHESPAPQEHTRLVEPAF